MAIGCDVGGTSIQATLLRGNRPTRSLDIPTPVRRGELVRELSGVILHLLGAAAGEGRAPPAAVGIGFCGLLDAGRRSVVRSTHLPELNGSRLAASVERRTGMPVTLDADTNAGAVGEAILGAGRGCSRVLYVTLGTGLGAALVVDRRPVRASHHTVGQVSEIRLRDVGPGGNMTRAESLLSGRGILARARRRRVRGEKARRLASTQDLFALARDGHPGARGVWRETGRILGQLLHVLVSLWSPDVVVIGGGISGAAELFLPAAERELTRSMRRAAGTPSLMTPQRGRLAGAIGAALLARQAHEEEDARKKKESRSNRR